MKYLINKKIEIDNYVDVLYYISFNSNIEKIECIKNDGTIVDITEKTMKGEDGKWKL